MIVKFFLSSSFLTSIKSMMKHVADKEVFDDFVSANGFFSPEMCDWLPKNKFIDKLKEDFELSDWKQYRQRRVKNVCYHIVFFFNWNERFLCVAERERILKSWFSQMGLDPDDLVYVAFNGHEVSPDSIHVVMSRFSNSDPVDAKVFSLNPYKNRYVCLEIERDFGLVVTAARDFG